MNHQRAERGWLSRSSNETSQSVEISRTAPIFNVLRLGQPRSASALHIVARGLALFLGGFGLLNVLGDFWHPGFDANLWWLDLRRLTPAFASALMVIASSSLIVFGLRPRRDGHGPRFPSVDL